MDSKMGTSKPAPAHYSDEHLLFYADGELSAWQGWRVRRHLSQCPHCRDRMGALQSMLTGLQRDQIDMLEPSADSAGSRALLRARIRGRTAELNRQRPPYLAPQQAFVRVLAYATILAILGSAALGLYRHRAFNTAAYAQPLPDPTYTPGSIRSVALDQLCSASSDAVANVPADLQQRVFREYGIKGTPAAEFEVDYLITPGLGGSEDVRNLWPEPHRNTQWNSYVKDQLEDRLHNMVCEHQIGLGEAQHAIASNWIVAYKKYFHTERPLLPDELRTENHAPALLRRLARRSLLMHTY
jgi:anti-sigma factor RsiW